MMRASIDSWEMVQPALGSDSARIRAFSRVIASASSTASSRVVVRHEVMLPSEQATC